MAAVAKVGSTFEAKPASVPVARRLVSEKLTATVPPEVRDPAVLLASELVTNAVLHAGKPFEVVLTVDPEVVRVEVHDPSARPPRMRKAKPGDTGGRGLQVIDRLASRWGSEPEGDGRAGKVVWFEIDR